jgi:hypothetical protein
MKAYEKGRGDMRTVVHKSFSQSHEIKSSVNRAVTNPVSLHQLLEITQHRLLWLMIIQHFGKCKTGFGHTPSGSTLM